MLKATFHRCIYTVIRLQPNNNTWKSYNSLFIIKFGISTTKSTILFSPIHIDRLSESLSLYLCGFWESFFIFSPPFFQKALDKCLKKCGASRLLINKVYPFGTAGTDFLIWRCVSLKPINIGGHSAYQNRVLTQLRKYYPNAVNSLSDSW